MSQPLRMIEFENSAPPAQESDGPKPKPERQAAVDAFRGLTIFGMLLVNNIALDQHTPAQLKHAGWGRGATFADMVFPWFLLIVGLALPYARASALRRGQSGLLWLVKAAGRCLALVGFGCLIDSAAARQPVFDLNVLQLIGLAYFAAAVFAGMRLLPRLALAASLLLGHWALLHGFPVAGLPRGAMTEGHSAITEINRLYLARWHLGGLVSVLPTSGLVLIGTALGELLRTPRLTPPRRVAALWLVGAGLVGLGVLWNLALPFSKPIWTGSYILYTAGWGTLVLGTLYGVIDAFQFRPLAWPLAVFGANPILAYVAPILTKLMILQVWTWPGTHVLLQTAFLHEAIRRWGVVQGGWAYTLSYIGVWWGLLAILHCRKIYLRV